MSHSPVVESTIYVCQSGTCRSKGSDAALVEIEELASLFEKTASTNATVEVEATGCLGYCRRGPAVAIETTSKVSRSRTRVHVGVNTLEKSAAVLEEATSGWKASLRDLPPETEKKLSVIRETKEREYLIQNYQWNKALGSLLRSAQNAGSDRNRLWEELKSVLESAGYPDVSDRELLEMNYGNTNLSAQFRTIPDHIDGYVRWNLTSVEIVSQHSAIFRLATKNPRRGTPHPRGRGKLPKPNTWHVTMLGELNTDEGPLPWIERDYTPISTGLEWERGSCSILIKIYNDGKLTQWLRQKTRAVCEPSEKRVQGENPVLVPREETVLWLSKPLPTLTLPSLALFGDETQQPPKSVLLLLAGTGIVALPQILAHREPAKLLGISTQRRNTLQCPIDLIHSCRSDDLLMIPEIRQYCLASQQETAQPKRRFQGLRNYTLLTTDGDSTGSLEAPFEAEMKGSNSTQGGLQKLLGDLPNSTVRSSQRLDEAIVFKALEKMVFPCRVVVSGPDAYNDAARRFLEQANSNSVGGDPKLQITILSA